MTTTVLQGATTTLLNQIFQYPGGPAQDLTGVTIAIESADGTTTVLAATSTGVQHPETGVWTYDWAIDPDQAPGGYIVTWSGTSGADTITTTEVVIVAAVPTYAAQLATARRYDRVPYQATDAAGNPIPGALFSLWDGVLGGNGANQVTNITTLDSAPIPGGILVGDARGYAPGFLDPNKTPNLFIIGSADGIIPGVDPVLIEPSDTDDRVIALEAFVSGPSGLDDRVSALEAGSGGGGGAAGTITDLLERTFNVRDYGAVADGTSDDAPGIQAACDAAVATGGGVVIIPPGSYRCGTFVAVGADTTIWAYGAYIKAVGNTGLVRNFRSTDTFSAYTAPSRIRIYGGTWDGNAGDGTGGTTTAETDVLNFVHCRDIIVRDVTVRNVSSAHGLEFNSTDGGQALNCRFEGFRDNSGTSARQYSEAIQIDTAVSGSSSIGAFDNTTSRNILVQGCYAGPAVDGSGNGAFGKLAGSHTVAAGTFYDNIRIIGNVCDGALDIGIRGYGWRRSLIADNIVLSPVSHGIAFSTNADAIDAVTVDGNIIISAGGSAILVDGVASGTLATNAVVNNNTCIGATAGTIVMQFCDRPSAVGNVVRGGSSTGILFQNGNAGKISANTVVAPGSNCFNVTSQNGTLIQGNTGRAPVTNYIVNLLTATDCMVVGNYFSDPVLNLAVINFSTSTQKNTAIANSFRKGGTASAYAFRSNTSSGFVNYGINNDCKGFTDAAVFTAASGQTDGFEWRTGTTTTKGSVTTTFPATTNAGANLVG